MRVIKSRVFYKQYCSKKLRGLPDNPARRLCFLKKTANVAATENAQLSEINRRLENVKKLLAENLRRD
ncbi:MAG: hypothetical protein HAW59_05840 [Betaproteobacteria bacterium]|nr:hypothetical protein [Betaproteobacteria bacterium]